VGRLATGAGLAGRLFGPTVAGVTVRLDGDMPESDHDDEVAAVATAVPRRRHEFLVGRACAHAALAAIGRDTGAILVGPRREPRWPPGVVGSIAHGGNWVGAVVTLATDTRGLGIDIEPVEPPLPPGVENLVLSPGDRARLPDEATLARRWAKVAFTAKECVYKALSPSTGWFVDYADVDVDIDLVTGHWRAALDERFPLAGAGLSGRFEEHGGHLFTGLRVAIETP
jgi:4'-phosphopantetheinyl transferase EntD